MIGRSLNQRYGVRGFLPEADTVRLVTSHLESHGKLIVQVRAADPKMIVCLVVDADEAAVRTCRAVGLELALGGTGVFGLLGDDAARAFPELRTHEREWVRAGCGPRETKVLVIERGLGLASIETKDQKATVTALAQPAPS